MSVGWCNTYDGRKVSRVGMCEVRSRKNGQEPKKKEKKSTVVSSKKKSTVMSPIRRQLCLCQGKWVISEGNWDFKVPFFPTRRLGWIFQISFFFSDQVLGPSSGGTMCFLGQMRGFMKCLGPKLDILGARDWKYSNKLP